MIWTYDQAFNSLRNFETLEPNWDSYGALPIAYPALAFARQWLECFQHDAIPAPWVIPTCHGGVAMEWHHNGWDIDLEIAPEGVWKGQLACRHDDLIPDYDEVENPTDEQILKIVRLPIDNPVPSVL